MRLSGFCWLLCSVLLLCSACAGSHSATGHYGPHGFWKPNRFDRHGREQGRWRTYYDAGNTRTQPFTEGRYRHGRPVRTFRYYDPTGRLDRTEQYERKGFCEVTYWHPGGQVARRGNAQWVTGPGQAPRFYWYGPWTSYDENGQTTSIQTYTDGSLTRAETYENGQLSRVETYEPVHHNLTRSEVYTDGKLIKVETFEKGRRTGFTDNL
jgi:antitoxin component YwqK of YwqJK toxin-antitoxin module